MAYNLLGQQGTYGTRNPDPNLSDAEATYLYDKPPGEGDNKGLRYTSYGREVVDKEKHNEKAEEANVEEAKTTEPPKKDLSSTSFGEKEPVEAAEVLPPITSTERNSIKSFSDLAKITSSKRLEENDINLLLGLNPEWTREDINQIISGKSIPWWQQMGFDSIDEANSEFGKGSLDIKDYEKFKKEQDEIDKALENRSTATSTASTTTQANNAAYQVTIYKDGQEKTLDVRDPQLQGFLDNDWSTEKTVGSTSESKQYLASTQVTIYKDGQEKKVDFRTVDSYVADGWSTDKGFVPVASSSLETPQEFVSEQVIVIGPNGARTTAQKNKRPGEDMSEYERLIAGLIPGREGYKDADKINYVDTYGGHTTGEIVSADYKGDYGGEDASTPDSERESLVGAGNTGYDTKDYSSVVTEGVATSSGQFVGQPGSNQDTVFNNIPTGAKVFDVDGDYYLGYLVPGGDGSLYTGSIYMMYQVPNNDFVKSGLLTDASAFKGANSFLTKEDLNTGGAIVAGTTVELEGIEGNPFLQFVERINDNVAISPWLATADGLALSAEVALEGRDPTPGEYRQLKWFQETTEEQRDWYELSLGRGFNNLPLDAKQAYENTRRNVKNNLLSLGIAGGFDPETGMLRDVPPGLVDYISQKAVSGEWSESKTTEQLRLFADPFAAGERDEAFFNVVEAGGYDQIDRQMQYEDTVRQEALKWLGPVAGNYNSTWVANWGSRLRSGEADAFQQLQTMLKQQRVALFDAYTNPELTYEDISQPWKNIVENAWGEVPDESQTYFQDIVKNNNVTYANEVLTKVGLEQGNDKVVNDALNSLEQSIGQGTVRRNLGANT